MENELKKRIIEKLNKGEELPVEWARFLFPPEKREYELVYHGKEREEDILADTLAVPLQPVRTFGKNGVDWHNMLVFGDNLQAMKSLLEMKKAGKICNADGTPGVRLVYIDPPFATKQEFRGTQDQKAYQDKIVNSQFLEFLRKRLILIHELLSDNGSLFLHCDWRMNSHIRLICEEIFQKEKFHNELIWTYSRMASKGQMKFNNTHQTIYWFRKTSQFVFNVNSVRTEYAEGSKNRAGYAKKGVGSGLLKKGSMCELNPHGKFPDDWFDIPFERNPFYPTQKPESLLKKIIAVASNSGDVVLDAFAGSGTTLAVAEKMDRRWIGIDCGKLSVYTMQKRMLNIAASKNLKNENKLYSKSSQPFTLYNAGLYDFSKLKELSWESWRFFALQLFQCREDRHKIGGFWFDGYLKGSSVLIFDHTKNPGARFTEETLEEMHEAIGSRVGKKLFIIAPALTFGFQQDYIDIDGVRYYALRIPYSIINELHQRQFTALKQPADEMAVNDTVEAVGFDFIRTPELKFKCGAAKRKGEMFNEGIIKIQTFKSEAVVREPLRKKENLETLSTVMLDYDYDGEVFDLDVVFYADALSNADWEVHFPLESLGAKMMAVFIDIYGNEARVLLEASEFGIKTGKKARKAVAK